MPSTRKKVTTVTAWKAAAKGTEVEVPSGNVALLRRVDPRIFMKTGRIPNSLLKIVNQAISGKEPDLDKLAEEVGEDPTMLIDMMTMMDDICVEAVVQPKVSPVPPGGEERDDSVLYVDEVDMDDKMFIFNWAVGGSSDLERFRQEQGTMLGRVRAVAGDGSPAE